jgi:hypothetical protein
MRSREKPNWVFTEERSNERHAHGCLPDLDHRHRRLRRDRATRPRRAARVLGWTARVTKTVFDIRLISKHGKAVRDHLVKREIRVDGSMADHKRFDLLLVPGGDRSQFEDDGDLIREVGRLAGASGIVASVCTGAFLVAPNPVANGKTMVTHHMAKARFRERFEPRVNTPLPPRIPLHEFVKDPQLMDAFRRGVRKMKARKPSDPLSWFYQAAIHGVPAEMIQVAAAGVKLVENDGKLEAKVVDPDPGVNRVDQKKNWNQCPHFGQASANFLPWHRGYTYYFERILRAHTGEPRFSLSGSKTSYHPLSSS